MTANKIVTNHLMELPIGVAVDQDRGLGELPDKPTSAKDADEPGNYTSSDEQMPMALFNGC